MLDIVASYHCMQFQGKLITQTQENGGKNIFLGPMLAPLAKFGPSIFFFKKNLALLVTRHHGQLSSCTIPEKTNDPILRKLSGRPKDGRTRVIS